MPFEKILPFALALTLASLGIFLNANIDPHFIWANALLQWCFYTSFLLSLWFINLKISHFPIKKIAILNLLIIVTYGILAKHLFAIHSYFIATIRFAMPTTLFIILQQYIKAIKQREQLIIENLQLKAESYKAELENLKKQLNPHFLFNSLTTLQTVIRTDVVVAEKYVLNLAEIYRKVLQNVNTDKTTLKEEIQFIRTYFFLQKTRFEEGLNLEINILPESLPFCLPTFALQLLVENCIKHNIISEEKPLNIEIFQNSSNSISISNNLQLKIKNNNSENTGLNNLRRRYELLGIVNGVEIEQTAEKYSVSLVLF